MKNSSENLRRVYLYAFQNQERDDEIKGRGNSYNYTYRMHDSRLGRFFAVDPLVWKYPFYSSYQFSSNSPIFTVELEGLESSYLINYTEKNSITLTKNKDNQFVIDMTEVDKLNQEYRSNIQGASSSRPHDAIPAPGTRIQAISSGSKDIHTWTIIIPKTATVMTDEDIQAMNQKKLSETNNIEPSIKKANAAGNTSPILPVTPVSRTRPNANDLRSIKKGEKISFNVNVKFGIWNTDIQNEGEIKGQLDNVAQSLKKDKLIHIWISGMGMSDGKTTSPTNPNYTAEMNNNDRAKVIRQELIDRGVSNDQITIGTPIDNSSKRGVQITARKK